jgi:membrane protein DedA with SNARE-associated domain
MESLIEQFGYVAIVVATVIEGGTALCIGGFLAHQGYLQLIPWVVAAGFVGNTLDGQLWFALSRRYGLRVVERRPGWKAGLARVDAVFRRHPVWLIVFGRFVPGARTLGWIAAGLSRVPATRYAALNAVGALLWAFAIAGLGYLFGRALEGVLGDIKRAELPIAVGIALVGTIWWILERRRHLRGR